MWRKVNRLSYDPSRLWGEFSCFSRFLLRCKILLNLWANASDNELLHRYHLLNESHQGCHWELESDWYLAFSNLFPGKDGSPGKMLHSNSKAIKHNTELWVPSYISPSCPRGTILVMSFLLHSSWGSLGLFGGGGLECCCGKGKLCSVDGYWKWTHFLSLSFGQNLKSTPTQVFILPFRMRKFTVLKFKGK